MVESGAMRRIEIEGLRGAERGGPASTGAAFPAVTVGCIFTPVERAYVIGAGRGTLGRHVAGGGFLRCRL